LKLQKKREAKAEIKRLKRIEEGYADEGLGGKRSRGLGGKRKGYREGFRVMRKGYAAKFYGHPEGFR